MSRSSGAIKLLKPAAFAVLMTTVFGFAGAVQAYEIRPEAGGQPELDHLQPTGRGFGVPDPSGRTARNAQQYLTFSTNGIYYHGGPLILGTVNMYYIWYGAWDVSGATGSTYSILNNFGSGIGGTPYFGINKTYYNSSNTKVSGAVTLPAQQNNAVDAYSQTSALNDAAVQTIVTNAISNGTVPFDDNGVYFVLTSKDVTETSGFCSKYCAWHTHASMTSNGITKDIKYGFVGSPQQCPTACSAQSTSPNGSMEADGMANLVAHELAEATTDPDLNAWFDRRGYENADKCAWKFGTTSTMSSGAKYNVTFNSTNWLLQQNWLNASGGKCVIGN